MKNRAICTKMSKSTQPTSLKMTLGERQEERKSPASRVLVSPTSISMEGLSVESKLTKQYKSAKAVKYSNI